MAAGIGGQGDKAERPTAVGGSITFILRRTFVDGSRRIHDRDRQEARVRTLLIQLLTNSPLSLHELDSNVSSDDNRTVITATLSALERIDNQVEQIASRMSMEVAVVGISWKVTTLT